MSPLRTERKKSMLRKIYAELSVDELCLLGEDDIGTIEALEREFGWLKESGISLEQTMIADADEDDTWCASRS